MKLKMLLGITILLICACSVVNQGTGSWGFKIETDWGFYQDVDKKIDNHIESQPFVDWLLPETKSTADSNSTP